MSAPQMEPESIFTYFTSEELAELTGTSHGWMLQQCRFGLLAHHKSGDSVYFTADDLRAIAEQGARPRSRRSRNSSSTPPPMTPPQ
ncbi:helix-turn-helix domain-containing protein [Pedococcus bigeumensis]|uniref:helix-turn-helix domain-containing protein n=1 Tax=Pedococcus bigeumensis TaxID=433644 RepID=UPI002FEA1F18